MTPEEKAAFDEACRKAQESPPLEERLQERLPTPPWVSNPDFEDLPAEQQKELAKVYFKEFASVVIQSIVEDATRAAVLAVLNDQCLCGGPLGHSPGGIHCRKGP